MNASGEPRDESGDVGAATATESPMDGDRASARAPAGVGLVRPARSLVRVLYTSNPFYILSADLVFAGLGSRSAMGGRPPSRGRWRAASRATRCYWRRPPAS